MTKVDANLKPAVRKPYTKPTLLKGPVISDVTAQVGFSAGITTNGAAKG
jgi:hypothetical protein